MKLKRTESEVAKNVQRQNIDAAKCESGKCKTFKIDTISKRQERPTKKNIKNEIMKYKLDPSCQKTKCNFSKIGSQHDEANQPNCKKKLLLQNPGLNVIQTCDRIVISKCDHQNGLTQSHYHCTKIGQRKRTNGQHVAINSSGLVINSHLSKMTKNLSNTKTSGDYNRVQNTRKGKVTYQSVNKGFSDKLVTNDGCDPRLNTIQNKPSRLTNLNRKTLNRLQMAQTSKHKILESNPKVIQNQVKHSGGKTRTQFLKFFLYLSLFLFPLLLDVVASAASNEIHRHSHHPRHWRYPLRERHRRSSLMLFDPGPHLSSSINASTWPAKRVAEIPGDIVIGGLQMVHEREDTLICGPVMPQGGLQAAEVMLYTVDKVNEQGVLPPPLKLGAYVLDDCDKDTYGLQQAVDFIKGSISNIGDDTVSKCKDGSSPEIRNKVISGVVGAASSVTSIQVANLLRLFKIPQVSFFSTSPELSNKQRFEYFSRTIPSDLYQTIAMGKIVEKLGWKYLSIVYEESNYGIKAFEELERLFTKSGICVAVKEKLTKDSGVAGAFDYNHIVDKLLAKPKARGVIVFGSDQEVAELMKAVKRMNATGHFSWIGSDGWSARALVSDGHEAEVEGTLSVQPQAHPVIGFEEYFLNLTVKTNTRNPWFVEFWEDHFRCRYPGAMSTPHNLGYHQVCTGEERLTRENTQFEAQLQFVSDAVMAFAHAFRDMHHHVCGKDFVGLCDKMKPIDGEVLLKFLRQVNFTGLSGDNFRFDENGDGPARYNIIHYKQVTPGQYQWVNVGYFQDDQIQLNMDQVQFQVDNPSPPPSLCSLPCSRGQMKKYVEGESCCWTCHQCGHYQQLDPNDETRCLMCPNGTLPGNDHLECVALPEEYLTPESPLAIVAMTIALVGIVITSAVLGVYIRFNDTPVVRASGRELSYVLLVGLLLCYAVTFLLVVKPTDLICGIQQFTIGLCFSIVYGALLTKTNRIARIFDASKRSAKRPNFISPKSQLIICAGLVLVQVLINVIWILVSPPEAIHHHPTREDNLLVCKASINASYMIAFTYPILLVIICTVYAVLTRKIPEAFNESKFIGFSMYTTCVIWLAFIPIYFSTAQHVDLRITSMSFTISLSATVTIVCLFTPKLYIVLLHPEKNIRQSMMTQSKYQNSLKTNNVNGQNNSQPTATKGISKINENGGIELQERIVATVGRSTVAGGSGTCHCCQSGCKAAAGNSQVINPSNLISQGAQIKLESQQNVPSVGQSSPPPQPSPPPQSSPPKVEASPQIESEASSAAAPAVVEALTYEPKSTQTSPKKSVSSTATQTFNNFAVNLNSTLPPLTQEVPDVSL